MVVRRVRILKRMPAGGENHIELMKRLLKKSRLLKNPRIDPKTESGRLSEADFMEKLATMKKEGEEQKPKKRFRGGTNLRENIYYKLSRFKKEKR